MLASVDVAVLQACRSLFVPLIAEERDITFVRNSFEESGRFSQGQVATRTCDFCVGCGEYLLFDGYFLNEVEGL
jgi:hypothetical protein